MADNREGERADQGPATVRMDGTDPEVGDPFRIVTGEDAIPRRQRRDAEVASAWEKLTAGDTIFIPERTPRLSQAIRVHAKAAGRVVHANWTGRGFIVWLDA